MSTATAEYEVEVVEEHEREVVSSGGMTAITKSEIDQQISTAKRYPRSVKKFINSSLELVTLNEDVAGECIYSLPRGKKPIEGPSARFAEVVASTWGNCRAGARVIDEDDRFVTAQGFFLDVENNVGITYETRRRITDKQGNTFNDDMIGVTSNAACSIALRNAVLKGIPKALWKQIYDAAKKTAIGDAETLVSRRVKMMQAFAKMFVQPEQIFTLLEVQGEADISLDHLAALRGVFTAIKEGDTTVDQVFGDHQTGGGKVSKSSLSEKLDGLKNGHGNGTAKTAETAATDKQPEQTNVNGSHEHDDAHRTFDKVGNGAAQEPETTQQQSSQSDETPMSDLALDIESKLNHSGLTRAQNAQLKMDIGTHLTRKELSLRDATHLQGIIDRNTERFKAQK